MDEGKENRSEKKKKGIEVGPWGGNGGTSWDDGSYHGVREITLVFGHCIDSIRVMYDKNGKPVAGEKHGGVGGNQTAEIKLQFPDEYLVSVSGYYCPVVHGGSPVIRSLAFKSNKRSFGPFGMEHGTPFFFPVDGGRIVGFKGRSGWYLDSIGFHVSQAQPAKLLQRVHKTFRRLASTAVSKPLSTSKDGEHRRRERVEAREVCQYIDAINKLAIQTLLFPLAVVKNMELLESSVNHVPV
ncbi:jacalin-related lectin 19 isoform X2 [Rhodamnia argentea]|uniref:Jacalin-related lectin 19 isoform X2 n=1 Tax=Rhodamnia argentea TaxID=178133 RepID=A0ABM3H068_9MYRT|nr:jacalin-related lectin 19 isoform X2 [Rhodamnia argentea]